MSLWINNVFNEELDPQKIKMAEIQFEAQRHNYHNPVWTNVYLIIIQMGTSIREKPLSSHPFVDPANNPAYKGF